MNRAASFLVGWTLVFAACWVSEATAQRPGGNAERFELPNPSLPQLGSTRPWLRSSTFVEYLGDNYDGFENNDGFSAVVNRFNLGTDTRTPDYRLEVSARLDTQTLLDDETLCDTNDDGSVSATEASICRHDDDYRLERFLVRATLGDLKLSAGDVHVNYGRGLGLSVRKIDEIGVDATIKGGRVDYRFDPVTVSLLGGLANQQNSDFATRKLVPDPGYPAIECDIDSDDNRFGTPLWTTCSDLVAGGRVEAKLPQKITAGAQYAFIDFGESSSASVDDKLHVIGVDADRRNLFEHWDLFAGASVVLRNPQLDGLDASTNRYEGYAVYLSNNFFFGSTTALLELKHYQDYLVARTPQTLQYTEAPTLEREDQQVPSSANATGGRLRVDHLWRDLDLTVFGNMLAYAFTENIRQNVFDHDPDCRKGGAQFSTECPDVALALHPYAGFTLRRDGYTLQLSGGFRLERHFHDLGPGDGHLRRKFPHGDLYFTLPLGRAAGFDHSMTVRGDARWETKQIRNFDDLSFAKGNVIVGYNLSPLLSLSFIGGFSTEFPGLTDEPILQEQDCRTENGAEICVRKPQLWPGIELRVNYFSNSFVRVFVGRQVGGRICVNGSCRTLPDFEGARAEIVVGL